MTVAENHADQEPNLLTRTLKRLMGNRAIKARSAFEIHEMIEKGLPSQDIIHFVESVELFHDKIIVAKVIGMSERTLYRRVKKPEPLTAEQSSRTWRFAEILTKAEDVLGDPKEAQRWMNTPAMGLEGRKPIDLITTQVGYELVDDFLTRMDYGVYT
ncbi:type II RES/Xre toxin-antitoxin system antitoxin [Halomonas sp. LBP4]|uniref:type II RES/Xre toxin-antitoxin system antitoxin n=1 Tax=Halomonas sp. LBP4 TaxID=2044917 RepID=UPI000D76D2BA|nr:antitoxin Xre/MbcA/ParS toxin-binding domain-containing protein [Halomonas sp. LBP4]PXX99352.1 toxin-antitoxin system antitoxin component [Halomonas sp. LBP4]